MFVKGAKALLGEWWVFLFVIVGIALSTWIVWSAWDNIEFRLHSVEVTGRVVDIDSQTKTIRRDNRNKTVTYYTTTVEYQDAAGRTHRFRPDFVSGVPTLGPIQVRYHYEHPEDARVAGFMETWFQLLFWLPFALLMTIFPPFVLMDAWRKAVAKPAIALIARPPEGPLGPPRKSTAPLDPNAVAKSIARQRRRRGGA